MKITDLFIKRPVLALVVNLVILLAGFQSIHVLNIRQYPRSDIAVIKVSTVYVGANADLVRGYITTPLERVIAAAEGIDYIESSSTQGSSTITVHLKLNYDPNAALTQIQAKLAQVRNELPPESENPVIELQNADELRAAMYLGFADQGMEPNKITDFLVRVIQPKLTAIAGIQRADVLGARVMAMRIWLKPDRLSALGVTASDVRKALQANNYLAAVGKTKGTMTAINLIANTNLTSPEEFRQLVVKQKGGVLVRLQDVAEVELGAEDYDSDVRFDGKKAKFIGIWCLPTANVLDVCKSVRKQLPELRKMLPPGMTLDVPYDSTDFIRDSIKEVFKTLTETLLIVVLVIFLFLGSLRSVLIPVVAIPISLIGTAFIMVLFGFSVNLLTLLAVVLAVGLVVDDAIVVVENVERHIHEGFSPLHAALRSGRELFGPIIAMTITLAAVYTLHAEAPCSRPDSRRLLGPHPAGPLPALSQGALTQGGSGNRLLHRAGLPLLHHRSDASLFRSCQGCHVLTSRNRSHLPDHPSRRRLRRHSYRALERAQEELRATRRGTREKDG